MVAAAAAAFALSHTTWALSNGTTVQLTTPAAAGSMVAAAAAAFALSHTTWALSNGTTVQLYPLPIAASPSASARMLVSGRDALAVGLRHWPPCRLDAPSRASLLLEYALVSSGLAVVPVNNSSSNTGATVSSVVSCDDVKTMGDFNGDGTDDVLCNGTRVVLVSSVAPESHGALGIVRLALPAAPPDPGPAAGSAAARVVAPIGDEDGDGIPDVSVAAADGIRIVTLHRDGSTRASALVLGATSASGASYVRASGTLLKIVSENDDNQCLRWWQYRTWKGSARMLIAEFI